MMQSDTLPNLAATTQPSKRRYSALAVVVLSFCSADAYRDVARRWGGIGFLYLILVAAITAVPPAIAAHVRLAEIMNVQVPELLSDFPLIQLKSGEASARGYSSDVYSFVDHQSNRPLLYVDTTGRPETGHRSTAIIELSKRELTIHLQHYPYIVISVSDLPTVTFGSKQVAAILQSAVYWLGPAVFVVVFCAGLIGRFVLAMLLGAAGQILRRIFAADLDYSALVRLAAVAMTPAVILAMFVDLTDLSIPFAPIVFSAIGLSFFFFALKSNAPSNSRLVAAQK